MGYVFEFIYTIVGASSSSEGLNSIPAKWLTSSLSLSSHDTSWHLYSAGIPISMVA